MSLSEDGADEEQSDADIMSLSEDGADEESVRCRYNVALRGRSRR